MAACVFGAVIEHHRASCLGVEGEEMAQARWQGRWIPRGFNFDGKELLILSEHKIDLFSVSGAPIVEREADVDVFLSSQKTNCSLSMPESGLRSILLKS